MHKDPLRPSGLNATGVDCSAIVSSTRVIIIPCTALTLPFSQPNVASVSCNRGECAVHACEAGFESLDGQTCSLSKDTQFRLQKYRLI